jgi:hypothetical protein
MDERVKKAKKNIEVLSKVSLGKKPHIRWNIEPVDNDYGGSDIDYFLFVIHRNPDFVLSKIEKQFREYSFGFSFWREPGFKGQVKNSVNSYNFVNYRAHQGPNEFDFSLINLPAFRDRKLSKFYRKNERWDIVDYIGSIVE